VTHAVAEGTRALDAGVARLGVALPDGGAAKLAAYLALLAKWNRTYNLTAIREPERMVTHHALDSLAIVPALPAHAIRVLDVGSGGGLPGIPIAIARPDAEVVMIDASDALFYAWLVLWGITVSGDSPQFSTLTARNAPPQAVGSVLTLTNSIGFAISIVSILLFVWLAETVPLAHLLPWLAMGPALGLWALWPLVKEERQAHA